MRRLAMLAAMAAALVVPSLALASGPPLARYTAKIATPSQLKGTWAFTFAKDGTYTIAQGAAVVVHGHYAALGSEITLSRETGPRACSQFGDYHWKRAGKTLKFTRVSDPCAGRALVLGHTFTVAA
jgi:hypothetical protein